MIDHKQNIEGLDNYICLIHHAMNTSLECNNLILDLDNDTHVTTLTYTNPINTKHINFLKMIIGSKLPPFNNSCLHNHHNEVGWIKATHCMFQGQQHGDLSQLSCAFNMCINFQLIIWYGVKYLKKIKWVYILRAYK